MKELGSSFSFIGSEYKIKIGDRNNYVDLLLFNYEYNCFVVVELKVTELKKEHIGQIQIYMNYIDYVKKADYKLFNPLTEKEINDSIKYMENVLNELKFENKWR